MPSGFDKTVAPSTLMSLASPRPVFLPKSNCGNFRQSEKAFYWSLARRIGEILEWKSPRSSYLTPLHGNGRAKSRQQPEILVFGLKITCCSSVWTWLKWLLYKWLQLDVKGDKTRVLSVQTLQIWRQSPPPRLPLFFRLTVGGFGRDEATYRCLFEAVIVKQPRLKPEPVGVIPLFFSPPPHHPCLFCFLSHSPFLFLPLTPISAPLPPRGPGPLPALSLTPPCSQITSSRVSR